MARLRNIHSILIILLAAKTTLSASLHGGHMDNVPNQNAQRSSKNEKVPDPSALIQPGYNLPDQLFNRGRPFYVERDPITGAMDFSNNNRYVEAYDYSDAEPSSDLYDKANIDRKDSGFGSHRPNDLNQLSPNFHDYLNLPVKYNPEKYVYPLISSSYANTKIQGNVNGHRHYTTSPSSTTTQVPPKYYATTPSADMPTTVGTAKPAMVQEIYFTTKATPKPYPGGPTEPATSTKRTLSLFEQLFGEYDEPTTIAPSGPTAVQQEDKVRTDAPQTNAPIGVNQSGDPVEYEYEEYEYDDRVETEKPTPVGTLSTTTSTVSTSTVPVKTSTTTTTTSTTTTTTTTKKPMPAVVTPTKTVPTTVAPPTTKHPAPFTPPKVDPNKPYIYSIVSSAPPSPTNNTANKTTNYFVFSPVKDYEFLENGEDYADYPSETQHTNQTEKSPVASPSSTAAASTKASTTSTTTENTPYLKVTSMPLGTTYHPATHAPIRRPAAAEEKQAPTSYKATYPHKVQFPSSTSSAGGVFMSVPSKSSIRIAADQDTASFVIGHQQSVDGGHYIGSSLKEPAFHVPQKPQLFPEAGASSAKIQPMMGSEASLSIGMPADQIKPVHGQVVDEKLEIPHHQKVKFPEEKPNREILALASKPMYHQLPSDLTPPSEPEHKPEQRKPPRGGLRPPWDPRPGHFFPGRPEYARPPRPGKPDAFKRVDVLPNILPQFRPNVKQHQQFAHQRQPLLDRPSNRPIGFFETLQPPPPPPPKRLQELRRTSSDHKITYADPTAGSKDIFSLFQSPPKIASKRVGEDESEIATLQMIQAKHTDKEKKEKPEESPQHQVVTPAAPALRRKEPTEKPLYVVYPVNSAPVKLDSDGDEPVVIGTRNEQPLPPSRIKDSPVLHKNDFPYPLERPEVDLDSNKVNKLDSYSVINRYDPVVPSDRWTSVADSSERISATLKTITADNKPIAIAYTPTAPPPATAFSQRQGVVSHSDSEFTLSAVMHAHANAAANPEPAKVAVPYAPKPYYPESKNQVETDRLGFEAPFQPSAAIDSANQGWSVIVDKRRSDVSEEATGTGTATTLPPPAADSSSEFDIENFKPELFGGFRPIYTYPNERDSADAESGERQE